MRYILLALAFCICMTAHSWAEDAVEKTLTLKDHTYAPSVLNVPAGQKIRLTVKNDDDTAAEFESSDLNREKIVTGHKEITVFIGPLNAGNYGFFDDFHRDTTKGTIVAK